MNLRTCLDQCSFGLLRQIAAVHEVALSEPPARAEVVHALLERLLAPGYLQQFFEKRPPEEQRALALVAHDGGQSRGFVLERRLRQHTGDEADDEGVQAILGTLVQAGLLFRTFQAIGPDRGEIFALPDELLALVPARPAVPTMPPASVDSPNETRRCSSSFNLFAMASFVRRWRQREARLPQGEGQLIALSRETAELAIELPGRSSRERWTLLAHLGLQLGLFAREQGGLHATEHLSGWLGLGEAAERRLWAAYVGSEHWNDLERAGSGGGRFVGRTAEPVAARAQVLDLIRSLPSSDWLLLSEAERLVRERAPDFLREGFEVATSRLVDLQSGEVLGGADSWERVEGQMVRYLLSGPLFWLGALEWGRGTADWDRVRLTPPGRAWLAGSEEVLRTPREPIELHDDRRLVASERSDLGLLWQLEPYLALERRGPPSEYRLTRASFARGLEAGGSAADLSRLLERATGGDLMLPFRLALERWGARSGRLRLRPMVVLSAEDPDELSGLLERADVAGLVRERLGPAAAAVTPARAIELAEALERHGHLPEVDAALRLMAGRRAYSTLVDQHTLETLLFCLRLIGTFKPSLIRELPNAEALTRRLEQALGPIAAPRISRRARAAARRLREQLRTESSRPPGNAVARRSEPVL